MKTFSTKVALFTAALAVSAASSAQKLDVDAEAAPEITRGAADIRAVLVPRPDLDTIDTALVFTNPGNGPSLVVCAGRNANGAGVGRAKTVVPAHGVRLILASDLSNGRDFVGTAVCKARRRVIPSAFVVGTGLSDAPARINHGWDHTEMTFPVIASF